MNASKCILCGSYNGYNSIETSFGKVLADHNFPYLLQDFETLSYKNYQCKNCGGSDRDRLYALYIKKAHIGAKANDTLKLLDFAPSPQLSGFLKKIPGVDYRSADLFMDEVDDKVDVTDMRAYKNDSFNFFICSHILEHVESDEKALSELFRVLKPGGSGILMTPIIDKAGVMDEDPTVTDENERIRRFAQKDHVRLYEKTEFMRRVEDAGFRVESISWWQLGLLDWLRNGLTLKSRLYVVHKDLAV